METCTTNFCSWSKLSIYSHLSISTLRLLSTVMWLFLLYVASPMCIQVLFGFRSPPAAGTNQFVVCIIMSLFGISRTHILPLYFLYSMRMSRFYGPGCGLLLNYDEITPISSLCSMPWSALPTVGLLRFIGGSA